MHIRLRRVAAIAVVAPLLVACNKDDNAQGDTAQTAMADSAAGSMSGTNNGSAAADQNVAQMIATVDRAEIEAARLAVSKATNAEVKAFAQKMIDDHTSNLRMLTDMAGRSGWTMPDSTAMMGGGTNATTGGATSGTGTGTGTTGSAMAGSGSGAGTATAAAGAAAGGTVAGTGNGATGAAAGTPSTATMQPPASGDLADLHAMHRNTMQQLQSATGAAFDRTYINSQVTAHQQVLDRLRQQSSQVQNADLRNHVNQTQAAVEEHLRRAQEIQQKVGT